MFDSSLDIHGQQGYGKIIEMLQCPDLVMSLGFE